MSDPNFSAQPVGGYRFDDQDYARMEVDTVVCGLCKCVIPKDESERDEYDEIYLCGECAQAVRRMCAGRVA